MNGSLPDDIRILAHKQADNNFNARYDCVSRTYKYFFIGNNMDIELMKIACK